MYYCVAPPDEGQWREEKELSDTTLLTTGEMGGAKPKSIRALSLTGRVKPATRAEAHNGGERLDRRWI